jgi:hypothetical protein
MQNRFRFFLFFLLLLSKICSAQSWNNYTINVCTSASKGYYFLAPFGLNPTTNVTHLILDSSGAVIYYNEFPPGQNTGDFKIQRNGLMSYTYQGKFFMMDSTFTVVDSVTTQNGITFDAHDLQILSDGHYLLLGTEVVPMNLSSYFMFGPNHTNPGGLNANVTCGVIQEQDASHNVVWEWHSKNYFSFTDVDTFFVGSPNNVDWTHMNAVEQDNDGNILVSSRHFDEITKINHSDSTIIWRLGGNANQFTFPNDPTRFRGQHDIRRIPNGNITLFDNGRDGSVIHPAQGKEYQLDEISHIATLKWSFENAPNEFSSATGNCQRTNNENTLIDWGISGTIPQAFDVVDSLGTKIFEIQFADTLISYRSFNYPTLPWKLPQPEITCYYNGQYFLDAGSGYSEYLWSNGATTQLIPVTVADTFSVFVGLGNGGHLRSSLFVVTNISDPCSLNGIHENEPDSALTIYPDPAENFISVPAPFNGKQTDYHIFSIDGKFICNGATTGQIDIHSLGNGYYFLQLQGGNSVITNYKFIKAAR